MKKIYTVLSVIALIVLAAGCAKEMSDPDAASNELVKVDQTKGESIVTVNLSVPECPDVKTTLGAKDGNSYPVLWSAGDVITLNGTAATEFTPASGNATATAKFKVSNLAAPYNFLYGGVTGQGNQVTFPANQAYVANGFDPSAMPMYASVNSLGSSIPFSHAASLLKFSITGSKKIDSVTLTATDSNQSLSGNFTIGVGSDGLLNGSLTPASGGGAVNYNFGGHIQLSDTPFEFYVAVPAGTYAGGIALVIVDNDSGHMNVTVLDGSSNTLAPGKVIEFDNVVYIPAKENNLKQIWNAATFQEFVNAVAGGNKTLNARLTPSAASIDLSSIAGSFSSIEDYKGIFDGNGKTLSGLTKPMFDNLQGVVKNLTLNSTISTTETGQHWGIFAKQITPSLEVDDVPGLQNCIASGSITWTPASAIDSYMTLGGLVGNNRGGTITGCTNNATVTFASSGVTHTNQPSVGGVVGRTQKGGDLKTQGDISNCTNNGTVSVAAQFSQNIYMGGVVGYGVEKAESISGCTNSGLVKATASCSTGQALHIGGVMGMYKGTIESCSNLSGAEVTTEAGCTAASYICQGGVVGRLNRESDSYSGLTNAGDINVAASGAATGAYIGGIAGRCNEGASISDCTNTGGTIEFTGDISTCELHIGGIVGNTNKPVSNCTNGTAINAGGTYSLNASGKYYSVGGIVGYQKSDEPLTNNTNSAAITFSGASTGYSAVGGVVGYCNGVISGGGNSGTVTFSGSSNSQNVPIGGVAARTPSGKSGDRISGVTNSGKVVINTSTQSGKTVYVGGIVGHHQSGNLNGTNSGTLTVTRITCTILSLGGLAGTAVGSITSGSQNLASGDISIEGLTSNQQSYIGGLVGNLTGSDSSITGNNAGDVVVTSGSNIKRSYYLGGIVGRSEGPLSSCTNSGAVSNAARMSGGGDYYMQIGGIVGYNNGTSTISDCHNTGNVTNTANSTAYLYIGGISSESDAPISNCDNTGNVSNSGNSGNSHPICVGGIAGVNSAGITGSSNGTSTAAGGTISNSGTSAERLCVGGIYGYSNAEGSLSHSYNKGNVTNTGDVNNTDNQIFIGGGIGYQHNNSDSESSSYNKGIASVISYVDNSGAVSNDAETITTLNIGGIAAESWGSLEHCNNSGPISVNANVGKVLCMGGILGWWDTNASNSVTYCENKATGEVSVAPGTNLEGAFYVSGVIGGEEGNISATNSHLINRAPITLGEDTADGALTSAAIGNQTYSYLSGIGGGNGSTYVAYEYCENYGRILFRSTKHRYRAGGVVACAFRSPDHSKCVADIRTYKSRGGNYKDDIGGVIGYYKAETDNTIDDILYKGYLNTNSNSPRGYTALLVGRVNDDAVTFTDCKVGGRVRGVGSSPYNTVAFVCCTVAGHEINVENLIVETGTQRNSTAVTTLSLNYNNVGGSVGVLCFGTTSETNTTNLDPASTGTMTNCTIGSIDAYL